MMTCPTCGATNADEASACTTCGSPLTANATDITMDAGGDDVDDLAGGVLSRSAYLARSLQTAGAAIVGVHLVKLVFGVLRGAATSGAVQPKLNTLERIAVGVAEQTDATFVLALLFAVALVLLPWFLRDDIPWRSLRIAPFVLAVASVLAVLAAVAATLNVRANLVVQTQANAAFKWRLAAYLIQMLGLAVVAVVAGLVGMGVARPRAADYDGPILPDDAHGHEHDYAHPHDHDHG